MREEERSSVRRSFVLKFDRLSRHVFKLGTALNVYIEIEIGENSDKTSDGKSSKVCC